MFNAPRIQVGSDYIDLSGLRHLAKKHPEKFVLRVRDLIDQGKFSWEKVRDLRALWAATHDAKVTVYEDVGGMGVRAVQSSAFPVLAGDLTAAQVKKAYDAVPTIGQDLVTEMDDPNKGTYVTAVHALRNDDGAVKEGDRFFQVGAAEEATYIGHRRMGWMFDITGEMIEENSANDIVARINKLGEISAEDIEVHTLEQVTDKNSVVYKPNGVATALYATGNTSRPRLPSAGNTQSNALADETDIENALKILAGCKNERGERLYIPFADMVLLAPFAKSRLAYEILKSIGKFETTGGTTANIFKDGPWQGITLLTSPKLDDINDDTWYLGDFRKQFTRKWKLRMEYATEGSDNSLWLSNRVAARFRIAYDCEVGATDYVYVVQNTT